MATTREYEEEIQGLRVVLKGAKTKIKQQNEVLERLAQPPLVPGILIDVSGKYATVVSDQGTYELLKPDNLHTKVGDCVALNAETMQILEVLTHQSLGETAHILRIISEHTAEIDYQSSTRVVACGKPSSPLKQGDKVVLDKTATVILDNLGKERVRFNVSDSISVSWSDIGGLEEAKRQMIEAIELPHKYPKIFKYYNKRPPKGILLYGPPGCGKTMLGKATATSISSIHNSSKDGNGFIYVKGPEILDKYVGVSESIIRQLFQRAIEFKNLNGFPAVLFIDEADAILSRRGSGVVSDMEKTIVPMFLSEMDGLEESGALVMLVTNRPDTLDPAVIREGRIDFKIKVDRPTSESTYDIFMLNLVSLPINSPCSARGLAEMARDELFSNNYVLYRIHTKSKNTEYFTLKHIVSGGMIVSIVGKATSLALQRDIASKARTGIEECDIKSAISSTLIGNLDTDHDDELKEFANSIQGIVSIEKGGQDGTRENTGHKR